jgi:hypothetical protein
MVEDGPSFERHGPRPTDLAPPHRPDLIGVGATPQWIFLEVDRVDVRTSFCV